MRFVLEHPYWSALASLLACAIAAVAGFGVGIEGLQAVTRYTGRMGLAWFALIFSIAPLHRLAPGDWTKLALRSRRHVGLAFGAHHLAHLSVLLSYLHFSGNELNPSRAAGGVLGYGFLVVMMATSTDAAVKRLGAKNWKRLHRTGLWYLWIVFMMTYIPRLQGKVENAGGTRKEFLVCISIVIALALLRAVAALKTRRSRIYPLTS